MGFSRASEIRVGVIGYGASFNMGETQLRQMQRAGMTPVAAAELDAERRKAAERDFPGLRAYPSAGCMLRESDVNLVAVITPHNSHARLALQCLRAGRHVVCEKPFAVTTAQCDAMIREAAARDLLVTAYHNRHWDGCILEAVDQIRRKKVIGDVYRIEAHMGGYQKPDAWWRSSRSISGGILYDWGVHLLEYALQLVDSEVVEVAGFAKEGYWAPQTAWKDDTNEDAACATVRFRNGAWLTLTVSSLESNPKRGMLEVTGTAGAYIMEGGAYEIIRRSGGQTTTVTGLNRKGEHDQFYRNIAAHLVRGTRIVITPEWARRPIHILDLACRSARLGRALRAKYG